MEQELAQRRLAGRYQIVELLAKGGMAEVYLAKLGELEGLETLVVVKQILPHFASDEQFVGMFLDEARIAAGLNHPNVIRIIEVGRTDDGLGFPAYFMAMELVQGLSLAEILRGGRPAPLTERLIALIGAQVAAGLHHAHTLTDPDGTPRHVVHRDVSPQNVLVSFDGVVKVIDFGIARAYGRVTSTAQGSMKGKHGYMAPEQARGDDLDHRADIFALGVVLWEAVTGSRLFRRDNELATLRAILDEPIAPPRAQTPVDPALEAIIVRALARDPGQRYATADELREALEAFALGQGGALDPVDELAAFLGTTFPAEKSAWRARVRAALGPGSRLWRAGSVPGPVAVSLTPMPASPSSEAHTHVPTRLDRPVVLRKSALGPGTLLAVAVAILVGGVALGWVLWGQPPGENTLRELEPASAVAPPEIEPTPALEAPKVVSPLSPLPRDKPEPPPRVGLPASRPAEGAAPGRPRPRPRLKPNPF